MRQRPRRDPISPEEAREAQAFANREGTAAAFEVAADAWEEAGGLKQAERMRWRANELHVADAAERLERLLKSIALSYGAYEIGHIDPRGDYWLSDLDLSKRTRSIVILVPFKPKPPREQEEYFRGYVEKSDRGFSGAYRFEPWRGFATEVTELEEVTASPQPIIAALSNVYREAIEDRLRKRGGRR